MMRHKMGRKTGSVTVAFVSFAISAAANAQGVGGTAPAATEAGAADSGPALNEIIVTAQRRSENLQNVPISVSVLSGADMAKSGISSQIALPLMTPNLTYSSNANNVAPYLRGVGTLYSLPGLESSVAVYFDDLYTPRATAGLLSFSDLQRVEVLKGPQGTLYGRNATGGAIRVITNDPSHDLDASASLLYGSYDRVAASGMVNAPLTSTLALRIAADYDDRDGYVKNVDRSKPDLQDRHQFTTLAKLLWEPSSRLKVKLAGSYTRKRDFDGLAFLPLSNEAPTQIGIALGGLPSPGFYTATQNVPTNDRAQSKARTQLKTAELRVDYEFDGFTLASITGYVDSRFRGRADADTINLSLQEVSSDEKSKSFSQELQAVSQTDGPFSWQAGAYYYDEKSSYDYGAFGSFVGEGLYLNGFGRVRVKSFAPYGQLGYDITEKLNLTVGARYTWETKRLLGNTVSAFGRGAEDNPVGDPVLLAEIPGAKLKFRKFTPKVLLNYKPIDNVLLYGSYSKGFKSGGFNLPSFGAVDQVQPENLTAYELGWKTQFGRLRFNGAAFHYIAKDLQVQTVDETAAVRVQNAGSSTTWGVETDVTFQATSRLQIGVGGGYLDATFKRYEGTRFLPAASTGACAADPSGQACLGYVTVTGDFAGNRLPFAPKFSGYLKGDYTLPLGDAGSLAFSALLNHTSKFYFDAAEDLTERSRELLNASITWSSRDGKYQVSAFGTNITDRKYRQFATRIAAGGWYIPAPPAEFGVKVSARY